MRKLRVGKGTGILKDVDMEAYLILMPDDSMANKDKEGLTKNGKIAIIICPKCKNYHCIGKGM